MFLIAYTRLNNPLCPWVDPSVQLYILYFFGVEWFSHGRSCPLTRELVAVYPALMNFKTVVGTRLNMAWQIKHPARPCKCAMVQSYLCSNEIEYWLELDVRRPNAATSTPLSRPKREARGKCRKLPRRLRSWRWQSRRKRDQTAEKSSRRCTRLGPSLRDKGDRNVGIITKIRSYGTIILFVNNFPHRNYVSNTKILQSNHTVSSNLCPWLKRNWWRSCKTTMKMSISRETVSRLWSWLFWVSLRENRNKRCQCH